MKMKPTKKAVAAAYVWLLLIAQGAAAQSANPITLQVSPGAVIPLGPEMDDGYSIFTIGAGAALSGEYAFSFAPWLYAQGVLDYSLLPTSAGTNLSLVSLGGGAGVRLSPFSIAELRVSAAGGYSAAIYQGATKTSFGGLPFVSAGLSMSFALSPSFSIGIGGKFDYHAIYYGVGAYLSLAFGLGSGGRAQIEFSAVRFDPVFPVFYKYISNENTTAKA